MTLDGKILQKAREEHSAQRTARTANHHARRRDMYAKSPRLREIDDALRQIVQNTMQIALAPPDTDSALKLEALEREGDTLQTERRAILDENGCAADYLDDTPRCLLCKDTGLLRNAAICDCVMDIYKTLQTAELSNLLNLGAEHFDAFSLKYYDGTARENMQLNYDVCRTYARTFGAHAKNLLLIGGTGLGKTFLSSCIARVVSDAGFSIVYDTAANIFARFEDEKFGRGDESDSNEIVRYLKADLLILDDLGTEMTTSFVQSALYTIINTRLLHKKQTIVSSNYPLDSLAARYTPQILSRLEGEYEILTFSGEDIRKLKKQGNVQ